MHRSGTAPNEINNAVLENCCVNRMPILPDKDDISRFICHPGESAIGAMERSSITASVPVLLSTRPAGSLAGSTSKTCGRP
jgi:hypothetical protein